MKTETRKLLTIITESALEHSLIKDVQRIGAHGYTITDARGKGHRGVREAGWETTSNIRMEIVCDAAVAAAISERLKTRYYDNYAMISFVADVEVLRPEKF